jgi:hypothetical protein
LLFLNSLVCHKDDSKAAVLVTGKQQVDIGQHKQVHILIGSQLIHLEVAHK